MATLSPSNIFISYARNDDDAIADIIYNTLIDFGCRVCLDRKTFSSYSGESWMVARDDWINNHCNVLYVVVSSNVFVQRTELINSLAATSDEDNRAEIIRNHIREGVLAEINIAKKCQKPVRAYILDRDAFDLFCQADLLNDEQEQAPDLAGEWERKEQGLSSESARQKLWVSAYPGVREYVAKLKDTTISWAEESIPKTIITSPSSRNGGQSSVGTSEDRILVPLDTLKDWSEVGKSSRTEDSAGFYVIVGPGGEGKTVLLCRRILKNQTSEHAVRVPLEVLAEGPDTLSKFIGAANARLIDEQVSVWRRKWNLIPVFYVDALEHVISPEMESSVLASLQSLVSVAPVFVTTRQEIWSSELQWMMHQSRTKDITGYATKEFLAQEPDLPDQASRILTNALFIDHFLRHRDNLTSKLENMKLSTFLYEHLLDYRPVSSSVLSTEKRCPDTSDICEVVADQQIEKHGYWVSVNKLVTSLQQHGFDGAAIVTALQDCVLLHHNRPKGMVRLRHDILDAANCARRLEGFNDQEIFKWFNTDLTPPERQIAGIFIRLRAEHWAVDNNDTSRDRFYKVFDCLLRMLDTKDAANYRSWCSTWILETLLMNEIQQVFVETILHVMNGDVIDSVPKTCNSILRNDVNYSSCISNPPRRTRGCVSSLTSLWRMFKPGFAPLPEKAIPAMSKVIYESKFRFRAIEALGKYPHDNRVKDILTTTAVDNLNKIEKRDGDADPALLASLAEGLAQYNTDSKVREILALIAECPDASARARRLAETAISEGSIIPVITNREFIEGFIPHAPDRPGQPSDWQLVDEYARALTKEATGPKKRTFGPFVIKAMSETLYHNHIAAAASVATALGNIGNPAAISGLISALRLRDSAPTVWHALRKSLISIALSNESLAGLVARSLSAIRPFVEALGDTSRLAVIEHVEDTIQRMTPIGTCCLGASVVGPIVPSIRFDQPVDSDDKPIGERARHISRIPHQDEVGPGMEDKYRVAFDRDEVGTWKPLLIRTDWPTGRGFHLGLGRITKDEYVDLLLRTCTEPESQLSRMPGLAVVHVICLLRDGSVLATKRPMNLLYRPGHWSLTLEEQLQPADFDQGPGQVAFAASLRGLKEELGVEERDVDTCLFQALIFEHENLNGAIAVGLKLKIDLDEVMAKRESSTPPSHANEVADIDRAPLGAFEGNGPLSPAHPTSRLRLLLLRYHLQLD